MKEKLDNKNSEIDLIKEKNQAEFDIKKEETDQLK